MAKVHGGTLIARALKREGVDTIFTLTGGHIVPILDGCVQEGIRIVDVRHEQSAAHAAEAYSRLTGRLGVAAVTAGPGVTDAVTGVANAFYSHTPMLLLGGRHLTRQELMGGLQEMDHPRLFHSITAWSATAAQLDRLPDYIGTAARRAFSGRGGPVFLDIPMDVQFDMIDEDAVTWPSDYRPNASAGADAATLDAIVARLADAERPMIFAGAGSRPGEDNPYPELAEALGAPTYLNSRARGSLPHGHPLLGNHTRSQAMAEADLVLALGVDWDFRTGYGQKISPEAFVVQVDADATKIGWNRPAHLGVVADPATVARQLVARAAEFAREQSAWSEGVMAADRAKQAEFEAQAADESSPINPQRFAKEVAEFFGPTRSSPSTAATSSPPRPAGSRYPTPAMSSTPARSAPSARERRSPSPPRSCSPKSASASSTATGPSGSPGSNTTPWCATVCPSSGCWATTASGTTSRPSTASASLTVWWPRTGRRPYADVVASLGGHGEVVTEPSGLADALKRAEASGLPALVDVHIAETMRMSSNYSQ